MTTTVQIPTPMESLTLLAKHASLYRELARQPNITAEGYARRSARAANLNKVIDEQAARLLRATTDEEILRVVELIKLTAEVDGIPEQDTLFAIAFITGTLR